MPDLPQNCPHHGDPIVEHAISLTDGALVSDSREFACGCSVDANLLGSYEAPPSWQIREHYVLISRDRDAGRGFTP